MAKLRLLSIIVLAIIISILVLPFSSAFGTDDDLKYQIHNSGTCSITIEDTSGTSYTYNIIVSVRSVGNNIYAKFDGTPQLPVSYQYPNFGSNACERFGLNYETIKFWDLVKYGTIEGAVDYCPNGAIDPNIYDGINNLKCNMLCVPEQAVCTSSSILAKCSVDGKEIIHTECSCENNACRTAEKNLYVQTDKTAYSLGENINVTGIFTTLGTGNAGVTVIAQLRKSSGVLSELQGTTDADGKVKFVFVKPSTSGETTVKLMVPNYLGRAYEASKVIQITGSSIKYEVATYSSTQYSSKNITFTVTMKDSKGLDILPSQLTNLHPVITLTQGTVYTGEVSYKGSGLYEITSKVGGSGSFVGKLAFNFEGLPQSSPIITIDVRPMGISIDASRISPGAYLNDTIKYTISVLDSTGEKLDPDSISIKVSLPDGTTVRTIPFSEIKKVEKGVYEFSYTYDQVEKHTFDIYADYKDYARGNVKASVAVSAEGDDFGPGVGGFGKSLNWILYGGIGLLVLYFMFRRKR